MMLIAPTSIASKFISPDVLHINSNVIIEEKKALGKKRLGTTEYLILGIALDFLKNLITTQKIANSARTRTNHWAEFIANIATPSITRTPSHVNHTSLLDFFRLNFFITIYFFDWVFILCKNIHNYILMSTFLI